MTQIESDRIKRLFKLVEVTQEFEMVNLQLVDQFNKLREEHGLMQLLLLIKEYAQTYTATTHPPETKNPNQNPTVVP